MGESCVQGLGRFTVVGTFPFSDFHEATEQTKMASMIQFKRWLHLCDPEVQQIEKKVYTLLGLGKGWVCKTILWQKKDHFGIWRTVQCHIKRC